MIRLFLLATYLLLSHLPSLTAMSQAGVQTVPIAIVEAIGVRTLQYEDARRQRPVMVELWYPTEQKPTQPDETADKVWIHPKESRNASLATRQTSYPLIVMSHGHRGD